MRDRSCVRSRSVTFTTESFDRFADIPAGQYVKPIRGRTREAGREGGFIVDHEISSYLLIPSNSGINFKRQLAGSAASVFRPFLLIFFSPTTQTTVSPDGRRPSRRRGRAAHEVNAFPKTLNALDSLNVIKRVLYICPFTLVN